MPMWSYYYGWPMEFWMIAFSAVVILLLGLAMWAWAWWLTNRARPQRSELFDILRERYARGEIDSATFDEMRERLGTRDEAHRHPTPAQS